MNAARDSDATVHIDHETCVRSRQCTYAHPRVFRIAAAGYPELVPDSLSSELLAEAEAAAMVCPSGSITVTPRPDG